MPMAAATATVRRFVLTDIMGTLRTPVLPTDTMARRGLAVESLLELAPGTAATMAVATDMATAAFMATAVAMDMDEAMVMVVVDMPTDVEGMDAVATLAVVAATVEAVSMAAAEDSTVVAAMVAADTDNSAD